VVRPTDLLQGTLELLVLQVLAVGSLNGWGVSQQLHILSGAVLQVSDGSLYPALHRLEQAGLIRAEWRPSENNRRAKWYSLTPPGRRRLRAERAEWDRLSGGVQRVLNLGEA
jgi:PadR family transcriptional regulator